MSITELVKRLSRMTLYQSQDLTLYQSQDLSQYFKCVIIGTNSDNERNFSTIRKIYRLLKQF